MTKLRRIVGMLIVLAAILGCTVSDGDEEIDSSGGGCACGEEQMDVRLQDGGTK